MSAAGSFAQGTIQPKRQPTPRKERGKSGPSSSLFVTDRQGGLGKIRNCTFLGVLTAQARLRTTRNDKRQHMAARLKPCPLATLVLKISSHVSVATNAPRNVGHREFSLSLTPDADIPAELLLAPARAGRSHYTSGTLALHEGDARTTRARRSHLPELIGLASS